jgi:hypothetical protein
MLSHLKVKVFSLSAEMTYIRRQEEKWKTKARLARLKRDATITKDGWNDDQVNAGNKLQYAYDNFWPHRTHRYSLKVEARHAHLAYGCIKGILYSRMETICYGPLKGYGSTEPKWGTIQDMVERFAKDEPNKREIMQRAEEWVAEAITWYEGNPSRIEAATTVKLAYRESDAYKAKRKMYLASWESRRLLMQHGGVK